MEHDMFFFIGLMLVALGTTGRRFIRFNKSRSKPAVIDNVVWIDQWRRRKVDGWLTASEKTG